MGSFFESPEAQEALRTWEEITQAKRLRLIEAYARGRVDEVRLAVHTVLAARSLPCSPDVRDRIDHEPRLSVLRSWLKAAVAAGSIGDVFRDG
jgi:hypothetical protein